MEVDAAAEQARLEEKGTSDNAWTHRASLYSPEVRITGASHHPRTAVSGAAVTLFPLPH
jgi:hypothetical protein